MRRYLFLVFLLLLITMNCTFSKDSMEIPLKFDMTSNKLYQFQVPVTLGMPVDFGLGFNSIIPAGYFYVFSEEKREKAFLFAKRTVEIKRIKVMWGLSEEFLFEFRLQHIYNDTFNIQNIAEFFGFSSPVAGIPLTFTYDFRTFGSGSNPVLNTFGQGYTNMGPVELNLFFQAYRDRQRQLGLTEIGLKVYDTRSFGFVLGDLLGIFSTVDFKDLNNRFKPRFATGYSRKTDSLSFAFLLHSDASVNERTTLNLNTMLLLPVSGEPYWSFQGQYNYSNQLSVIFNCSLDGFYFENKYIFDLATLFPNG